MGWLSHAYRLLSRRILECGDEGTGREHEPVRTHPAAVPLEGDEICPREDHPHGAVEKPVGEPVARIPDDHGIGMITGQRNARVLKVPVGIAHRNEKRGPPCICEHGRRGNGRREYLVFIHGEPHRPEPAGHRGSGPPCRVGYEPHREALFSQRPEGRDCLVPDVKNPVEVQKKPLDSLHPSPRRTNRSTSSLQNAWERGIFPEDSATSLSIYRAGCSFAHSLMRGSVISGWNWTPAALPRRNIWCFTSRPFQRRTAPPGRSKVSPWNWKTSIRSGHFRKCSGLSLAIPHQPNSRAPGYTREPAASAISCAPRHIPTTGLPSRRYRRIISFSVAMKGNSLSSWTDMPPPRMTRGERISGGGSPVSYSRWISKGMPRALKRSGKNPGPSESMCWKRAISRPPVCTGFTHARVGDERSNIFSPGGKQGRGTGRTVPSISSSEKGDRLDVPASEAFNSIIPYSMSWNNGLHKHR